MIVCLQTRQGVIHSIYHMATTKYYTICEKVFNKEKTLSIFVLFALDNVIETMCDKCRQEIIEEPRVRKFDLCSSLYEEYIDTVNGFIDTKSMYIDVLDYRSFPKLRKYKKKIAR